MGTDMCTNPREREFKRWIVGRVQNAGESEKVQSTRTVGTQRKAEREQAGAHSVVNRVVPVHCY